MADLTSLENVKRYVGLPANTVADDAELARLISSCSADFERAIGREIMRRSYSETRDGDGGALLYLSHGPVGEITSLTVDGVAVLPRQTLSGSGYVVDLELARLRLVGTTFAPGIANVSIVYTAGHAIVPNDVEQAVIRLVGVQFKDKDHIGQSYRVMEGQVVDFRASSDLAYVRSVIDRWTTTNVA